MPQFDLLCTQDGDLDVSEGLQFTTTNSQSLKQRLDMNLQVNLGEFGFDTTLGMPYKQEILRGGFTKEEAIAEYLTNIYKETDVISAEVQFSSFDPYSRKLTLDPIVVQTEEGQISINPADPEIADDWTYPEPSDNELQVGCDQVPDSASVDRLYKLMNTDLPYNPSNPLSGDLTWEMLWEK